MCGRPPETRGRGRGRRGVCTDAWGPCAGSGQGGCDSPCLAVAAVGLGVGPGRADRKPKSLAREPEGFARKAFWVAVGRFWLARKPRRPVRKPAHPGRKAIRFARKLRRLARDGSRVAFARRRVLRVAACAWCEKACGRNAWGVARKPNTSRATCAGLRSGIGASRASHDGLRPGLRGLREPAPADADAPN